MFFPQFVTKFESVIVADLSTCVGLATELHVNDNNNGDDMRILVPLAFICSCAWADEYQVTLLDPAGQPVVDTVVTLMPTSGELPEISDTQTAIMDQVNKEFVPHILPVRSATQVSFPNSDATRHHVYSFSPAKPFELKLYKDFTTKPIDFDQAGIVEIGCNIHDWMLGYIYVTDSPYYAKTNEQGVAIITAPSSEYTVSVWSPYLAQSDIDDKDTVISSATPITFTLSEQPLERESYDDGFEQY